MVQSLHEFLEENINYLKENGLYNEIDTIEGANGPEIKINGKSYTVEFIATCHCYLRMF